MYISRFKFLRMGVKKILLLALLSASFSLSAQNYLVNGDFENGTIGFSTPNVGYTQLTPPFAGATVPGNYAITTDAQPVNTISFMAGGDHTSGAGNMMVIDGSTTAANRFWAAGSGTGICGLTIGTTYRFSYWIKSISNQVVDNATSANIQPVFSNVSASALVSGSATAPLPAAGWQQVVYTFTPSAPCITIELSNINLSAIGNDFAIDDLAVNAPLSVTTSATGQSCPSVADGAIIVYGSGGITPYTSYAISGPANTSNSTGVFTGVPAGNYGVTVTDSSGATVSKSNIIVAPAGDLTVSPSTTICANTPKQLTVSGGTTYQWTASPADPTLTAPTSSTPTVSPSQTTTYTVTSTVTLNRNLISIGGRPVI